jgi:hypothetical protein
LACLLTVAISGCATSEFGRFPKAYPGPRLPNAQVAELEARNFSRSRLQIYSFSHFDGNKTIDGSQIASVFEILPGPHTVGIEVQWSKGFQDNTNLEFSAAAGEKYVIGIYELEPGEDPTKADLGDHEIGFWEWLSHGAGPALMWPLMPFIIVFGLPILLLEGVMLEGVSHDICDSIQVLKE